MTVTTLVLIAALALLVFWAVGAYNRLVRLKNTIANAFGQIDVQLTFAAHYAANLDYKETPIQDGVLAFTSAMQLATSVPPLPP